MQFILCTYWLDLGMLLLSQLASSSVLTVITSYSFLFLVSVSTYPWQNFNLMTIKLHVAVIDLSTLMSSLRHLAAMCNWTSPMTLKLLTFPERMSNSYHLLCFKWMQVASQHIAVSHSLMCVTGRLMVHLEHSPSTWKCLQKELQKLVQPPSPQSQVS